MESALKVRTNVINSPVTYKDKVTVVENIRYPEFSCEDKRYDRLCAQMNKFYKAASARFSSHVHKSLAKKAYNNVLHTGKPYGAVMNYSMAFCGNDVVSIVVDLSGFDGVDNSSERLCQNWSVERASPVPPSYFVKSDRKSKKTLLENVLDCVRKNRENPAFGYYGDCERLAAKYFSVDNMCFVPNGAAFYIDPGLLCDAKYGPSVFVLPYDRVSECFRVIPQ